MIGEKAVAVARTLCQAARLAMPLAVRRFVWGGLCLQEFTAFLGVRDPELLGQLLAKDDGRADRYAPILGVQNLRWVLFQPTVDANTRVANPHEPYALVLSFTFEGELEDVLAELAERQSVREILATCHEFDVRTDPCPFLTSARVRSGFMYRDIGPVHEPDEGPGGSYPLDATRSEMEDACARQGEFEQFYSQHANATPADRLAAFLALFGERSFPLPLTEFERPQPDEYRWVKRASDLSVRLQARYGRLGLRRRRRGAHAKAHGFLHGTFTVEVVPEEYRVGLFSQPGATYDVRLRPSNGYPMVEGDAKGDARGLAMSVMLPGDRFNASKFLLKDRLGRQDFILFNQPVFFASDIREFTVLLSIMSSTSKLRMAFRFLAYTLVWRRFRPMWLLGRTLSGAVAHPLKPVFHSATPYLLGDLHIVKYSVEPEDPRVFDVYKVGEERDFLARTLSLSLGDSPIKLKLYLHVRKLAADRESMKNDVEDATVDWDARGEEKIHAATITLGPQEPTTDDRMTEAEGWLFNPWNALSAHRPLGSLNRGRLSIYRDSQTYRAAPSQAPTPAS
jgi:hypothetical protein